MIDSIDPVDPLQKNIQLQTAFGIYGSEVDPRVKTILNGIEPREFLCMIAELSAEDIL